LVQIRDYRILESIGEGGMGHVYRAVHVRLNRPVAIKVLRQDRVNSKEAVARFSREMQVIAQLDHPNIVRALDAGEQEGLHYLVMEFLAGVDVAQLSARLGPLPIPEACQIIQFAATALHFAHERKILHRDVKPSNILLTVDGGVKVLDLGLAQFSELNFEPSLSRTDQALGTLAYMAPEQLSRREEVTTRSDIFSLGVSLHEILTGQRPYERLGSSPLLADLSATRPDIDASLQSLINQMVASVPSQRPASMQEIIERLQPYAASADLPSLVHEYFR
jgi:serine/threonine protein kinase